MPHAQTNANPRSFALSKNRTRRLLAGIWPETHHSEWHVRDGADTSGLHKTAEPSQPRRHGKGKIENNESLLQTRRLECANSRICMVRSIAAPAITEE